MPLISFKQESAERSRLADFWLLFYRYPRITVSTVLAVAVALGISATRLTVNNDYDTWMPAGNPITQLFTEVSNDFSATGVIFVVLDLGNVFSPEGIAHIRKATEVIESLPGVFSATSLTNIIDFQEAEGSLQVQRLGDRIDPTPLGIRQFQDYVLGKEIYTSTFVSRNRRFANIIVNLQGELDEISLAGAVVEAMEKEFEKGKVYLGGDPIYKLAIEQYMHKDLKLAVSVAVLLMLLMLFLSFLNVSGTFLPIFLAGIAIIWVMGIKALNNWPANIITPGVIILSFALGSAYAVHVYNRFSKSRSGENPALEMGPPVIMSAVTTMAGLLTFAATRIPTLTYFGTEIAIGLAIAMFLSLAFLPALLQTLRIKRSGASAESEARLDWLAAAVFRLASIGMRYRLLVIVLLTILVAVAGYGISRIVTSANYLEMLPEDSLPIRASRILKEEFGGSFPQTIYFEGDIGKPSVLKAMSRIENFHRSHPDFSGCSSIAGLIAEENYILNGSATIPDTKEGVASLWLLLEGEPMLRNMVMPDRSRAVLNAFTWLEDTGSLQKADREVQEFLDRETGSELVTLDRAKLSPGLDETIHRLKAREAAQEITYLTRHYSEHYYTDNLESEIEHSLLHLLPCSLPSHELEGFLVLTEFYIEDDLFVDKTENADKLRDAAAMAFLHRWNEKIRFGGDLGEEIDLDLSGIDPEEQEMLLSDLSFWVERELQRLRISHTLREVAVVVPSISTPHFLKRARGIFRELYSRYPSFFTRKLEGISVPDEAVVSRTPVTVTQVGLPTLLTVFDRILHRSQLQSLFLASVIVFFMIWIGMGSIRGALFALMTVLTSIFIMLGVMGITNIPLDFGTVLTGGLIIGLGVDGVIHIIYRHRRSGAGSDQESIARSVSEVGRAVITANFTTGIGCYALVLSSNKAMFNFAIINGSAILLVTFLNLVLVPIYMSIFPIRPGKGPREEKNQKPVAGNR